MGVMAVLKGTPTTYNKDFQVGACRVQRCAREGPGCASLAREVKDCVNHFSCADLGTPLLHIRPYFRGTRPGDGRSCFHTQHNGCAAHTHDLLPTNAHPANTRAPQECWEMMFDTVDTVHDVVRIATGVLSTIKIRPERMKSGEGRGGARAVGPAARHAVQHGRVCFGYLRYLGHLGHLGHITHPGPTACGAGVV